MQYIDAYFASIFHIVNAYRNPDLSDELRSTIRTDIKKTMAIGAILAVGARFCIWKRFYLFKDYVKSATGGAIFGLAYSPYFLSKKVDQERLLLMMNEA